MGTKRIGFFATRKDYDPVISELESKVSLKYVLRGLSKVPQLQVYASAFSLPDLGLSMHGEPTLDNQYLVTRSTTEIHLVTIPQRRGGVRFEPEEGPGMPCVLF